MKIHPFKLFMVGMLVVNVETILRGALRYEGLWSFLIPIAIGAAGSSLYKWWARS